MAGGGFGFSGSGGGGAGRFGLSAATFSSTSCFLAVAPDRQLDLLVGRRVGDQPRQLPAALDRLAVIAEDHVARLQFGLRRRAAGIDRGDHRAAALVEPDALGEIVGDRLDAGADPAALDLSGRLELLDDRLRQRRRDREADADRAARRRIDHRVDADHLAGEVEHRPAGIAAVDRRIGLQIVVIGAGMDVARRRRDDPGGDGAAEPERVADRQHPVADPRLARIAPGGGRQRRLRRRS